ncbi:Aspartic peptidase domain [Ceraceosorus bombacis]|uniref:Aspartic peptidase domain n=1 Tax=Ceraceosorus bombacis TaxID=401625 RepID=A0A0P1BDD1_9BASI|nr:Aspartic peptidase domain [Ceraceosorus bombacis]
MRAFRSLLCLAALTATASSVPMVYKDGFWFTKVKVGEAQLNLLMDTGGGPILVNPGLYKPSSASGPAPGKGQHSWLLYESTEKDGSGTQNFTMRFHEETVSLPGSALSASKIVIGVLDDDSPALPGDGLIGFDNVNMWNYSTAFVPTSCAQGTLKPCKFGLQLNSDDTGAFITDDRLMQGPKEMATIGNGNKGSALDRKAFGWIAQNTSQVIQVTVGGVPVIGSSVDNFQVDSGTANTVMTPALATLHAVPTSHPQGYKIDGVQFDFLPQHIVARRDVAAERCYAGVVGDKNANSPM